jgi:hypothetical protein
LSEEVALDGAEFFEIAYAHGLEGSSQSASIDPIGRGGAANGSRRNAFTRMSLSLSAIGPTLTAGSLASRRAGLPAPAHPCAADSARAHPDVGLSSSKFRWLQDFAASSVTQRRFRTLAKKLTTVTLLSATRHFISDARRKRVSRALSDASGRQ